MFLNFCCLFIHNIIIFHIEHSFFRYKVVRIKMSEIGYEIDFLPVGDGEKSGDAIALRWGFLQAQDPKQQEVVVIDGGFQDSGEALVKHIRKYYRTNTVDCVFCSHPDRDHASGLLPVIENLAVQVLVMHRPWSHTRGISDWFQDGRVTDSSVKEKLKDSLEFAYKLEQVAKAKGIKIIEPFTGDSVPLNFNATLQILGPTESYYKSLLPDFRGTPEPKHTSLESIFQKAANFASDTISWITESFDIETLDDNGETSAENNSSVVLLFMINGDGLLFTGDAGITALNHAVSVLERNDFDFTNLKFIQVPHHGSKRNIGPSILNKIIGPKSSNDIKIKTAFVSASKNGAPKHPAKKVTNAFRRRGAPVFVTSGNGIWHYSNAPSRANYDSIVPLPFYTHVEE
jgi:beta-lactamase superfamily II metal-dependent hydrolase